VLPDRPLPAASTPAAMLVDLARRVLPTMAGAARAPAPSSPPPAPVRAIG